MYLSQAKQILAQNEHKIAHNMDIVRPCPRHILGDQHPLIFHGIYNLYIEDIIL